MNRVETVIIGGGISGMACARKLHEAGRDFLLLSDEIGGRMLTSKTHIIDYGASYITSEYTNVSKFVDKAQELRLHHLFFYDGDSFRSTFASLKLIPHLFKLLRFCLTLWDYARRVRRFRRRSMFEEQKRAIRRDPVLMRYLRDDSIAKFVKKRGLEFLHNTYFHPVLNSTVFLTDRETNLAIYFGVLVPIISRTYVADFRPTAHRLTKGWSDKIRLNHVKSLRRDSSEGYKIETSHGEYRSNNVVLALPYKEARHIYSHVPKPKHPGVPMYVFHVVGEREEAFRNREVVFFRPEHHDITILWKQRTGSDVIFSKIPNPNLTKYYLYHRIVKRVDWDTSVVVSGEELVDQILDEGLYLASDYNFTGLEDSFITGVFAANQIIKKSKLA